MSFPLPEPGMTPPTALTIAGSDSGGAAGLQSDLRTFLGCGVHGLVAVTAVTVQNTLGVHGRHDIPADLVAAQIEAVAEDMGIGAAKTGMLASAPIIEAVAEACARLGIGETVPFVVDPVAASMTGEALFDDAGLAALRDRLLPRATVLTPNLDEVRLLTGIEVTDRAGMHAAAEALHALGPRWVLVKSGHLQTDPECVDLLFDGERYTELPGPRFGTTHTHGAGDAMASALTAGLAHGMAVPDAARAAKRYVTESVRAAYPIGAKVGPVSAFWRLAEDRGDAEA